jgi:hypothetical protein
MRVGAQVLIHGPKRGKNFLSATFLIRPLAQLAHSALNGLGVHNPVRRSLGLRHHACP